MKKKGLFSLLDFNISPITMGELLYKIETFISENVPHTIVLFNPYLLLEARKYVEYGEYIKNANIVVADGFGLLLAARLLGHTLPERITGTDLMPLLGKLSQQKGYKIFLLGGEPGVAEKAKEKYEKMFPGVNIVGTYHGFFSKEEEKSIVEKIKKVQPDILVVCMGAYKQEMFIKRYLYELNVPVCFGNGAALDFFINKVKRAPVWMQKIGLEWLFRLIQEPRRLWKRYLIGNIVFIYLVIKEVLSKKFLRKN